MGGACQATFREGMPPSAPLRESQRGGDALWTFAFWWETPELPISSVLGIIYTRFIPYALKRFKSLSRGGLTLLALAVPEIQQLSVISAGVCLFVHQFDARIHHQLAVRRGKAVPISSRD